MPLFNVLIPSFPDFTDDVFFGDDDDNGGDFLFDEVFRPFVTVLVFLLEVPSVNLAGFFFGFELDDVDELPDGMTSSTPAILIFSLGSPFSIESSSYRTV